MLRPCVLFPDMFISFAHDCECFASASAAIAGPISFCNILYEDLLIDGGR